MRSSRGVEVLGLTVVRQPSDEQRSSFARVEWSEDRGSCVSGQAFSICHDSRTVPPVTVKMPKRSGGLAIALTGSPAARASTAAQDSKNGSANTAPAPRSAARRVSGAVQLADGFQTRMGILTSLSNCYRSPISSNHFPAIARLWRNGTLFTISVTRTLNL